MGKVFDAEYDASENVFRLTATPEGVADHEKVRLALISEEEASPSILAFSGVLSKEDGEDFARAINEMFPPWD